MTESEMKILGLLTGLENIQVMLFTFLVENNILDRNAVIDRFKKIIAQIEANPENDPDGMQRFPINRLVQCLSLISASSDPVVDRASLNGKKPQ